MIGFMNSKVFLLKYTVLCSVMLCHLQLGFVVSSRIIFSVLYSIQFHLVSRFCPGSLPFNLIYFENYPFTWLHFLAEVDIWFDSDRLRRIIKGMKMAAGESRTLKKRPNPPYEFLINLFNETLLYVQTYVNPTVYE